MRINHHEDDLENHDLGLDHDLPRLVRRRGLIKLVAGAGLVTLTACGTEAAGDTPTTPGGGPREGGGQPPRGEGPPDGGGPGGGGAESDRTVDEGEIPEETAGPYPADGSNGANVLSDSGVVRSDITASFGGSSTVAEGIPLTITMTLLNHDKDDAAYEGAAVYLWHCDRAGEYSLYSESIKEENYLRGVQEANGKGTVTFTSIFPACYSGRWPHIHFEVYPSLAKATNSQNKIATSQIALPEDACTQVFATEGYEQSKKNVSVVTLDSDNVFGDGYDLQIPELTGDTRSGYALTFECSI